jgi:hypothetical protein
MSMNKKKRTPAELRYRSYLNLPHPELRFVPPGSNLSEIVAAATHDPDLHSRVVVRIDGHEVQPEWWSRLRPHRHARVELAFRA